jgi:hypothetical protein
MRVQNRRTLSSVVGKPVSTSVARRVEIHGLQWLVGRT